MSPAPAQSRSVLPRNTPGDKRRHRRYPISLKLRYKLLDGNQTLHIGNGTTLNMSSRGVLFQADDILDAQEILTNSEVVVMEVDWPFQLNGICKLKFIMRGLIVRRDGTRLAVRIQRRELRLRGSERSVVSDL